MARPLTLESFGRRPKPPRPEPVKVVAPAPTVETPPPAPETTENWRLGHEAGYAAGAAASAAEHSAILTVANEAIAKAADERAAIAAEVARDAAKVLRALTEKLGTSLLERGFADAVLAELETWLARAAEGRGVLVVAPESRVAMRDAVADDPRFADVEIRAEDGLDRFAVRFEWSDGLAEFDAGAAVTAALEILDRRLAAVETDDKATND